MNLSVNGQSQVPPGFRFHPTEEELLLYYLKKKVSNQKIDLDVIQDIDLNKLEPWDIQEKCRIASTPQDDWYFFSHNDRKYPTGTRTNRSTAAGFWKATGRDKVIYCKSRRIGLRKTLVFYKGRAPHGQTSDWIMYEYRLDDDHNGSGSSGDQAAATEDVGWVVCRVFKKRNYVKALEIPHSTDLKAQMPSHDHQATPTKQENKTTSMRFIASDPGLTDMHLVQESFLQLPQLESPTDHTTDPLPFDHEPSTASWVEIDRLVAYQLNGLIATEASESTRQLSCFNSISADPNNHINMLPFCVRDDNDGSGGQTTSSTAPLQQLLRYQSTVHAYETTDDQLFWSSTKPSSSSTPMIDCSGARPLDELTTELANYLMSFQPQKHV